MNACQEVASSTTKLLDASKYNLRCNRNISEKMTKKDFIYDIPTPAQNMRKVFLLIYSNENCPWRVLKCYNFEKAIMHLTSFIDSS